MAKKVSVKVKAYQSDGLSRHCGKCNYNPCSLDMRRLCIIALLKVISKDMQEQRKILKKR